jgi:hypothetical protein
VSNEPFFYLKSSGKGEVFFKSIGRKKKETRVLWGKLSRASLIENRTKLSFMRFGNGSFFHHEYIHLVHPRYHAKAELLKRNQRNRNVLYVGVSTHSSLKMKRSPQAP